MSLVDHVRTSSARIREQLGYPVIDGDGHVLELLPAFADFVRDHGRSDLVEAAPVFKMGPEFWRAKREASVDERRARGILPGFWSATGDTDYFATVTTPSRYYERLGEAGIDFAVLYPTLGLHLGHVASDDQRLNLCRLYNEFMAEQYGPYRDRFTVAAAVPMHAPGEAIAAMEHAAGLGAKVALIPSYVRRPLPGDSPTGYGPGQFGSVGWLDTYGVDSAHDYDPVWAKAIELGLPLAAHSNGMGFSDRSSISNFVYNHIGHFASAGEALAKSLFLGGVTRRFAQLRVALLEGGVTVGVHLYVDLVAHWHKRGAPWVGRANPSNIDRERLGGLLVERDARLARYSPEELVAVWGSAADGQDDFAASGVQSDEDIRARFCPNFYWGCEADDPFVGLAFDARITPFGARVPAIMGSDIGHWDVPVFESPLAEAYQLVERGILDEQSFRDFVFTNSVRCYASLNPQFFRGTVIEREAAAALDRIL
jgi:predicted TIM-barrel fold metal-dependent hydrolase